MARVLEMSFATETGRSRTIRLADVNNMVTGGEVSACMDNIVTKNIFSGSSGELTAKVKAQIVTTSIDEISLN